MSSPIYVHRNGKKSGVTLPVDASRTPTTFVRIVVILATVVNLGFASMVSAEESGVIEEVLVTALRYETSLQDTPISITTIDASTLESAGIDDIRDLQFLAPSTHIADWYGQTMVTIRGIGNDVVSPGSDAGVAVYQDGVYLSRRYYMSGAFLDVERVDILRGPQGTLYGRNATGGVISTVTGMPTEELESRVALTFGSEDEVTFEGMISGPLGERLFGRVAIKTTKRDGFMKNVFSGDEYDDLDDKIGRIKLRYLPNDSVVVDLTADFRDSGGFGPAWRTDRYDPAIPLPQELAGGVLTPLSSEREINENRPHTLDADYSGLSLKVEWEFERFNFVSTTAYREMELYSAYDIDGTALDYADLEILSEQEQFTQEFNLVSNGQGNFDWVVGLFFLDEEELAGANVRFPTIPAFSISILSEIETKSIAAFADATFHVAEDVDLEIGIRVGRDERTLDPEEAYLYGLFELGPIFSRESFGFPNKDSWNSVTPRIAVTYHMSDQFSVYGSVSTGFKAGGFNVFGFQAEPYNSEEVIAYEVGFHQVGENGRLRTNGAVFFYDYTDLQQLQFTTFLTSVDNAAESKVFGAEFDFSFEVSDALKLSGSVSYLDATYEDWISQDPTEPGGPDGDVATLPNDFDLSGNRLVNTPKWTANLAAEYQISLGSRGTISFRGDAAYKSKSYSRPFQTNDRSDKIDGYILTNFRVTYRPIDGRWQMAAFVENASDELVASRKQTAAAALGGQINTVFLPPRRYGLKVSYQL